VSYLHPVRLHFSGRFRADGSTVNLVDDQQRSLVQGEFEPADFFDLQNGRSMFEFKTVLGELLQQKLTAGPNAGQFAGPRYRYVP
jgi:hypothetical protein